MFFAFNLLLPIFSPSDVYLIFSKQYGLYIILIGFLQVISARIFINHDKAFSFENFSKGGLNLIFGLALYRYTISNSILRILIALKSISIGVQAERPILAHPPVIFDVCVPFFLKKFYKSSKKEISSEEDYENVLKIRIGTGNSFKDFFGHTELFYDNKVYTFGNYNKLSRKFFDMYGDGIITVSQENLMNKFSKLIGETTFEYTISLTKEEDLSVRQKFEQLKEKCEEWVPKDKTKYLSTLEKVTKPNIYKVTQGPASNYYVLGMNCVTLKNYITKDINLPAFEDIEIPLPGATLSTLDKLYRKGQANIISRNIVN